MCDVIENGNEREDLDYEDTTFMGGGSLWLAIRMRRIIRHIKNIYI